jgi:hypothetical protein
MKKFKLNFKNLTTPLLVLSLILGCVGLFSGSTFAASTSFLATPNPVISGITGVEPPVGDWVFTTADHDNVGGYGIDWAGCSSALFTKMTVKYKVKNDPRNFTSAPGGRQGYYFTFVGNIATMTGFPLTSINGGFQSGSSNDLGIGMDTVGRGYGFNAPSSGDIEFSADLTNYTVSDLSNVIIASYNFDGDSVGSSMTQPEVTLTYDNSSCPVVATDPDISTTPSSTPVTINILGNDTGTNLNVSKIDNQTIASGDTITLTNGSGTVKLNTDSTITFTPNSTFSGESIFSYSITDGASTVDTGVVRITVAAATTTNTTTTTTTTTPSNPAASSASTNNTKVLAKTGEDVRLLAGGGMLVLVAAIYIANLRFKLGKY